MSLVFSWTVDTVSQLSGTEVGREGPCSGAAACTHSTGAHSTGYLWGCCKQGSPLSVSSYKSFCVYGFTLKINRESFSVKKAYVYKSPLKREFSVPLLENCPVLVEFN